MPGRHPLAGLSRSAARFVERRAHPRRITALPVRYRRIDPKDLGGCQEEFRKAVCRNISRGGMLLEVDAHFPPGEVLEIYANDRENETTLYGVVETVRAARSPDHYEIGVRFLSREEI